MKRLVMTVGLPRSGKSTWARTQGVPIVSPDAIRLALTGTRFLATAEPMVWAVAQAMVRALFTAGHDTVILDACNRTCARRGEWRSGAWTRAFLVFPADPAACRARALADGATDLLPVIDRMAQAFEPLGVCDEPYELVHPAEVLS